LLPTFKEKFKSILLKLYLKNPFYEDYVALISKPEKISLEKKTLEWYHLHRRKYHLKIVTN
jgi:hypothetical protein